MKTAVPSILPTKTEKNNSFFGGKAQPFFQRKLTIGSPNDVFEQEADATADRVMRSQGTSQPFFGKGLGAEIIHRKCAACEQEEKYLHKKGTDALAGMDAPSSVHEVISSSGQKMDFNTQNFMENRFGHDFSQIQIHTDSKAAASATAIQAKAYTAGNHVVFNTGEYAPHTQQGKHLLAHELTHTIQQGKGIERKVQRVVDNVEVNCSDNQIKFSHDGQITSYALDHCNISDGEYDAGVSLRPGRVDFDLGTVPVGTNFDFGYSIQPGQASPNTFFAGQQRVHIVCTHQASGLGGSTISIPITFEATPMFSFSPSTLPVTLGTLSHFGAMGDLSWLASGGNMRWGTMMGPRFWSSFFTTEIGLRPLDRVLHNPDIFSRLEPRIADQIRAGGPYSWASRGFTTAELLSIPDLIRRMNTQGIASLTPRELFILREAASLHIGGSSAGSPFASYSLPDTTAPFLEGAARDGRVRYRVRILADAASSLDVSAPSTFTNPQAGDLGNFSPDQLLNAEEFEVLVTAGDNPRLVSVQRVTPTSGNPSFMVRNAGAIRWGGRALFVVGAAMTADRIASATPAQRPRVIAQETGSWGGGYLGSELGVGACIAFGIATEGAGLLLCGLAGGLGGGLLGSSAMGAAYDATTGSGHRMTDRAPDGTYHDPDGTFHMGMGPKY